MAHTATHLLIHGRVQGVGYRAWFAAEARRRGLSGWVRNRRSGSVEALVLAAPAALYEFVAASRIGPRGAEVTDLQVAEASTELQGSSEASFEIHPTV